MSQEVTRRALEALRRVCEVREPIAPILRARSGRGAAQAKPTLRAPESLHAEQRFGVPHAKLYPFIGRKVRTPEGPGTLLQVFSGRATVLLDSARDKVCRFFAPEEIEPVSFEADP